MRLLTHALPGTGGVIKTTPEDFIVDELPAYPPSGEGSHTFVRIEKRGLTTDEAVARVSAAAGVRRDECGVAGQKDRQALTRQWISLPNVDPEKARTFVLENVRVLEAARHGHKLRTGHLSGNRFTLTVRGTSDGESRARAILEALSKSGMPNYYGAQRFGARGDNAARGRALLKGEPGRGVGRGERRLLISAWQSERFNRYLDARIDDGLLTTALLGDVLKKTDTGGLFTADEAALPDAQARLSSGALVVTGPMIGHKMMAPPAGTPSAAREEALLKEEDLPPRALAELGRLAEGTRRPLTIPVGGPAVRAGAEPDTLVLEFTLPPGSYATILMQEVTKTGVQ
jgi:tRNA pseudouridine13 synthase